MMNIFELLNEGIERLQSSGVLNARMEAQLVLSKIVDKPKEWLMVHFDEVVSSEDCIAFRDIIEKRIKGEPLQYLLREAYFMGLPFFVNENVLIPRADTEILVESVIQRFTQNEKIKILDMCTGSGCIAISIKKYLEQAFVFAADISKNAIEVAKNNALKNDVHVEFILSDKFINIPNIKFNVIVSNPPYLTEKEMEELQKEVTYEPSIALAGGKDGLDFYREISLRAKTYLEKNGLLAFEIGYKQGDDVLALLVEQGYENIEVLEDYSGNQRVVIAKWAGGLHESN